MKITTFCTNIMHRNKQIVKNIYTVYLYILLNESRIKQLCKNHEGIHELCQKSHVEI